MAYEYVRVDRDQLFLLPPSLRDWIPEDHLVCFLIDVVDQIDTAPFHARRRNEGAGRAAYDPDMMLTLLLYAYCTGLRSSRRIQRLCHSDLAYRVICANLVPDHRTIARFRAEHEQAIRGVFVQVLRLCGAAGLTTLGSVAIDGTKIGADAALDANRSREAITAAVDKIMEQVVGADEVDEVDEALFGAARGDELPTDLARPGSRLARLRAALAQIDAQDGEAQAASAAAQAHAQAAAEAGRKLRGRKPTDPAAAVARAEADLVAAQVKAETTKARQEAKAAKAAAAGRKVRGRAPGPDTTVVRAEAALAAARAAAAAAPPVKARVANVTDPDSRIMKTTQGFIQGYNAQAAVNEHQVVVGTGLTQQGNDCLQLVPMMAATAQQLTDAGTDTNIDLVLADAGYWSEANATAEGPDRLIATVKDWKQRRAAAELGTTTGPAPQGVSPVDAMEHRLRTTEGAASYAMRSHTVEPVFGDIKENQGYRRFMRRGLAAAHSEWDLICSAHNVLKLYRHGQVAPA